MNIRRIKLALTVELMNSSDNPIGSVKELMRQFKNQVGTLRKTSESGEVVLDDNNNLKSIVLQYDRCVVNLELVTNQYSRNQYLNKMDLAA